MLGYFLVSIVESLAVSQMRSEDHMKVRKLQDELLDGKLQIKGDESNSRTPAGKAKAKSKAAK